MAQTHKSQRNGREQLIYARGSHHSPIACLLISLCCRFLGGGGENVCAFCRRFYSSMALNARCESTVGELAQASGAPVYERAGV